MPTSSAVDFSKRRIEGLSGLVYGIVYSRMCLDLKASAHIAHPSSVAFVGGPGFVLGGGGLNGSTPPPPDNGLTT